MADTAHGTGSLKSSVFKTIFLVWRWSREVRRPFLAVEDVPLVVRMKGRAAEEEREFVMERVLAPSEVLQSAWVGSVWPFS